MPRGTPSAADEYLLYQTLLGTLPPGGLDEATRGPYAERIVRYMQKAAREAKLHTRWTYPDEAYEMALEGFARALLSPQADARFVNDLQTLGRTLAWFGALNSLSLTLLKFASPGVPDVYQGNELMDLSLVDPDNRRPVDYAVRARCLDELEALARADDLPARVAALGRAANDGRAKLWISWRMLSLRREHPALFREGDYRGLRAEGAKAAHVVAFARRHGEQLLVLIAARLFSSLSAPDEPPLGDTWEDTIVRLPELAEGTRFENVLTGETLVVHEGAIRISAAFAHFPGAALWAKP